MYHICCSSFPLQSLSINRSLFLNPASTVCACCFSSPYPLYLYRSAKRLNLSLCVHSRVHWVGSVINPIDSLNKLEYHFNLLCGHCLLPQLASNWGGVGVNYQAGIHLVWECVLGPMFDYLTHSPQRTHISYLSRIIFSGTHSFLHPHTHKSLEAIIVFYSLKNCCESSPKSEPFSKPAPKTKDALFCFADWSYKYLKNRDVD